MSLYRHKRSPFFQFDFEIQGYRFSGSTGLTDQRDAAAYEANEKAKARRLVQTAIATNSQPMTIERACARWFDEHGSTLAKDSGLKANLEALVATIGPRTPLHAITDEVVSRVVQERKRDVTRAGRDSDGRPLYRPITARTVNKSTLSLLRRVLRRARDNWDAAIIKEPIWKKHWLKETRRPVRELSAAEETALDQIESAEFAALRRFAIITGLRRGNLLLSWRQVDFELAEIRIISKGGVPRRLPLSREAYAILWQQRGLHPEFVFTYVARKSRTIPKSKLVRVKGKRYPMTVSGLASNQRSWAKAGVDARIHDLRHTTGMRTLRATGNLKVVQKLLGHSDIAITAKFYTDATVDDMRNAMEATAAEPRLLPAPGDKTSEGET